MSKANSWQSKNPSIFLVLLFREQIFLRVQRALQVKSQNWEIEKVGDGREIVVQKNGRVLAGKNNNGYYCFLGRMKGLCLWLVLIGLTPLKLVEDWFTAALILTLNPRPTGRFIIVFKRRKIFNLCVSLFSHPVNPLALKELGLASAPLLEGWCSNCLVN